MSESNRREWFHQTAMAAGIAAALRATQSTVVAAEPVKVTEGASILFQGDSITDAGRDKRRQGINDARSLGNGYPSLIAAELLRDYPTKQLKISNRGISGNKVPDLAKRWEADCLNLKPDVLSILIGVNDIWHKLNGRYEGTVEQYQKGFAELLAKTRAALPKVRLVICEPFVLRCGAINDDWFPEFDHRREAAAAVAKEAGAIWVPFQTMFDAAAEKVAPSYWAGDGVHPTLAGHSLMAQTWRKVVGI